MRVNLIYHRFPHHSTHSGYDRIGDYLNAEISVLNIEECIGGWIPWRIASRMIKRAGIEGYSSRAFYAEEAVIRNILIKNNEIYHFLYGEKTYAVPWTRMNQKEE